MLQLVMCNSIMHVWVYLKFAHASSHCKCEGVEILKTPNVNLTSLIPNLFSRSFAAILASFKENIFF